MVANPPHHRRRQNNASPGWHIRWETQLRGRNILARVRQLSCASSSSYGQSQIASQAHPRWGSQPAYTISRFFFTIRVGAGWVNANILGKCFKAQKGGWVSGWVTICLYVYSQQSFEKSLFGQQLPVQYLPISIAIAAKLARGSENCCPKISISNVVLLLKPKWLHRKEAAKAEQKKIEQNDKSSQLLCLLPFFAFGAHINTDLHSISILKNGYEIKFKFYELVQNKGKPLCLFSFTMQDTLSNPKMHICTCDYSPTVLTYFLP